MSIRRIRQAEMLSRSASNADLLSESLVARSVMRKSLSWPSIANPKFDASVHPAPGRGTKRRDARRKSVADKPRPAFRNEESVFLGLPVEIGLEILEYFSHGDLLRFRGTSRDCKRIADCRLKRTTAARLAACRENFDATREMVESMEEAVLPGMVLNHRYLGVVSNWNIDELRWMRNPSEEVRVVCQCMLALQKGHFAPNYLAERSENDAARFESWASIRAAMGTLEFRRWIARLRSSAEKLAARTDDGRLSLARYAPLSEDDLLSSGRLWATQIWQSTATGFERMREVSTVAHSALQFVSAAVHYISLRTSLVKAQKMNDTAHADVCRVERFWAAIAH